MRQLLIEELRYQLDSTELFARIQPLGQAVFLDSAYPFSAKGRYDILSAVPTETIKNIDFSEGYNNNLNLFQRLNTALEDHTPAIDNDYHLPFIGGAIGFIGYDQGRQLESLTNRHNLDLGCSDSHVGIYTWAIIVDHRQHRSLLVAHPAADRTILNAVKDALAMPAPTTSQAFTLSSSFKSNMSWAAYSAAFSQVKAYIEAGDCYQINLAQRFTAGYCGAPWQAYLRLRAAAAAPFSAYIDTGSSQLLCTSPERFHHVSNQRVTTSPIKGTMPRSNDPKRDQQLAQQLLNSEKDRAENLMIVDLLRNDLGKVCVPGSIQVDELFELQSFETVHHLVSTISGQLRADTSALQLLEKSFPGGSITGAPKVRAMEIIEELEPHRRSAYCGSVGYISCDGQMDTNIAIRTMMCERDNIYCWAGGGIVADSDCKAEYEECFTKVGKLMAALQN